MSKTTEKPRKRDTASTGQSITYTTENESEVEGVRQHSCNSLTVVMRVCTQCLHSCGGFVSFTIHTGLFSSCYQQVLTIPGESNWMQVSPNKMVRIQKNATVYTPGQMNHPTISSQSSYPVLVRLTDSIGRQMMCGVNLVLWTKVHTSQEHPLHIYMCRYNIWSILRLSMTLFDKNGRRPSSRKAPE